MVHTRHPIELAGHFGAQIAANIWGSPRPWQLSAHFSVAKKSDDGGSSQLEIPVGQELQPILPETIPRPRRPAALQQIGKIAPQYNFSFSTPQVPKIECQGQNSILLPNSSRLLSEPHQSHRLLPLGSSSCCVFRSHRQRTHALFISGLDWAQFYMLLPLTSKDF
jgi:hypothetical protein